MTTLTPQQIADLKASIAAKYTVVEDDGGFFFVAYEKNWDEVTGDDHMTSLDAEAELDRIIQDEVKAAIESHDPKCVCGHYHSEHYHDEDYGRLICNEVGCSCTHWEEQDEVKAAMEEMEEME